MSKNTLFKARRAVGEHIQSAVLEKEYNKLFAYLVLTLNMNKPTTIIALWKEQDMNSFSRFFLSFPIAIELGKLTIDLLVADWFHFNTPSYNGVCMNSMK